MILLISLVVALNVSAPLGENVESGFIPDVEKTVAVTSPATDTKEVKSSVRVKQHGTTNQELISDDDKVDDIDGKPT